MASKFSKKKKKQVPPNVDFAELAAETPFSVTEEEALHELYKKLSRSFVNDGYIQKIFDLFDVKQTGHIDFGEFVQSLAIFHPRTPEAGKIACAFKLYDLRHTGYIEHEETFKEADVSGDGRIDQEEWQMYAAKNPLLLPNMTLPYLMYAHLL